jgi:hypothetical protein
LRLLAAVLQAEDYKKLPQWRQSFLQGLCTGLALGRGVTAGVDVPLPSPEARPPNGYEVPALEEEVEEQETPLAPTAPALALAPEQIMALQELLARLRPDAPVHRDAPPAPPRRPGARPRTAIKVDGHSGTPPSASR